MQTFDFDHIHLKSENVKETKDWYCKVLGAKVTFEGEFRGSRVYYLDIQGTTFVLFGELKGEEPLPSSSRPRFGVDHFGFEVQDIDAVVTELRDKGVNILEGPTDVRPGLRIAYFEAPDHVRIELSQRD